MFSGRFFRAFNIWRKPHGIVGMQKEKCLCAALHGTVELFRRVLDRCAPGEHAGHMELPHPEEEDLKICVSGTILTLAAALDKPKHAALLLERGWDVNSGAPASAQAVHDAQRLIFGRTDSNIICETLAQRACLCLALGLRSDADDSAGMARELLILIFN